jgi:peptide/nickel transport system permease protein
VDKVLFHAAKMRLFNNRLQTMIIMMVALAILAAVVISGMLVMGNAQTTDFASKNLAPSFAHPFGTDWMGRDMFIRTLSGLAMSMFVGLLAATVSSLIAVGLGMAAALGGKRMDAVITWLIDLLMGLPHIILLILIAFAIGKGFWGVTIGVAVTHWPNLARVIRAEVLQCKQSNYIAHAEKLGTSKLKIAWRHITPYIIPQLLVGFVLLFPHAILHEAAITFLGFGLPPEQPAIGIILSEAMGHLSTGMWWLALFPGIALVAIVLLFDLAGSSLRRLIDPHRSQD